MSLSTSTNQPPPPLESRAALRGPSAAAGAHTTTSEGERGTDGCSCCHAHGAAHPVPAPTSTPSSSTAAPPSTPASGHRSGGQEGTYAAGISSSSSSPSPSKYYTPVGGERKAAGASSSASPLSLSSMCSPNQSFFAFGQLRQDTTTAVPEPPSFSFVAPPSPFSSPAASLSSSAHPSPLPTLRFESNPSPRTATTTHAFPQPDFDTSDRGDVGVGSRTDVQASMQGTSQGKQQAGATALPNTTRADDDGPRLSSHTSVDDVDGDVIMDPTPSTASPPESPSREYQDHHTSPRRKRAAVNDGRGRREGGDNAVSCGETVPCEAGDVVLESGVNGSADEYNRRADGGGARDVDEYEAENDMLAMLGEDQKEALLDALARWAVQGEFPDRPVQPLHGPRRQSMSAAAGGGGDFDFDGGDGGGSSIGEGTRGRARSAEGDHNQGATNEYDSVATTADPRAAIDSADDWLEATGLGGILPRDIPVPAAVFSDDKDLELCGTEELLPEPVTVEQLMEGLEKLGIMAEGKEG